MRPYQPPPVAAGDTIHVVSDTHHEVPQVNYPQHIARIAAGDLNTMTGRGSVVGWGHAGDQTTYATEPEFAAHQAWWGGLDRSGAPQLLTPGNHDLIGHARPVGSPDLFTPTQWAARLGLPGPCYSVDVGADLRVLCVAPAESGGAPRLRMDAERLAWCAEQMAATTRSCVILTHAPLLGTVYTPDDDVYCMHEDTPGSIAAMIAAAPNMRAWISGHTHSKVDTVGLVMPVTFGTVTVAAISVSTPLLGQTYPTPSIVSARITVLADRVEVRYRDHGARQWLAPLHTVMREA